MEADELIATLKSEMANPLIGQEQVVDTMIIALLTGGHLLLEGLPGLAKTLAVRTLANAIGGQFSRIQFTPDLLPADILGSTVYLPEQNKLETRLGPIKANLLLADEINRAPAKVQSALLEAMQERQVTIDGTTFPLPSPFMVIATENPIEHSGTYPLPEAQKDRFMMQVRLNYPARQEEEDILQRFGTNAPIEQRPPVIQLQQLATAAEALDQLHVAPAIKTYILDIVIATRPQEAHNLSQAQQGKATQKAIKDLTSLIETGASPRASITLLKASKAMALLNIRNFILPEDVKAAARLVLPHRLCLTFEAEAQKITPNKLVDSLLEQITTP